MALLTKSLYQLASGCPRKLFYQGRSDLYPNTKSDDEFMKALADGGHQVSALARSLYPNGILITSADPDEAFRQTTELLRQDEVVIFEAAVRFGNFYVRIDVLRKTAERIELLEVKAKSWDTAPGKATMVTQKSTVVPSWVEYLQDVAFQTWVARQAKLGTPIVPYLLLVDKSAVVNGDGLHQLFRIQRDGREVTVRITDQALAEKLGRSVLCLVEVVSHVDAIIAGTSKIAAENSDACGPSLPDRARLFAGYLTNSHPMPENAPIDMGCKNCEFRAGAHEVAAGMRSGFDECWSQRLAERHRPDRVPLFSLWNFPAAAGNKLMEEDGIYYLDEMSSSRLKTPSVRKDRQIACLQTLTDKEEIGEDLVATIGGWTYPLHFLDFETATPALPFHRGMRPYQILGFQFSCHHLHNDGSITHDEFLESEPGAFPSWRFLQALKRVLDKDGGTILRYSAHENTVLRSLRRQLLESASDQTGKFQSIPADFDVMEYAHWIDQITTQGKKDDEDGKVGPRSMVDLLPLVRNHYYHPRMGGSNSIKHVLPAVMTASAWLREQFSKPLTFGTNLRNHVLWQLDPGGQFPRDPYDLLPPVMGNMPAEFLDDEVNEEGIQSGGAAMMAYASMQYTDMPTEQRQAVSAALLRYCELDTLAMLMIVQHWKHALRML